MTLIFWGLVFGTRCHLFEAFCVIYETCVFLSLFALWLLMAEGGLLEHIWSKKSFQPQERRTWRVWFYTRTEQFVFYCPEIVQTTKKLQITCKKLVFGFKEPCLCKIFCLGFHFVVYQLATWSMRREQILPKVSVSRLSWPPSFGAKFALLGAHTWTSESCYLKGRRFCYIPRLRRVDLARF